MAVEANVLLSSGQKVRNLELVVVDPVTGAQNTVEAQVVVVADSRGLVQDYSSPGAIDEILDVLKEIRDLLTIALTP
jgi:hypothetical protein